MLFGIFVVLILGAYCCFSYKSEGPIPLIIGYALILIIAFFIFAFIHDKWKIHKEEKPKKDAERARYAAVMDRLYPFNKPQPPTENVLDKNSWQNVDYKKRMQKWYAKVQETGEYLTRRDVFDEVLEKRNPNRPRGGPNCIICGRPHTTCTSSGSTESGVICSYCSPLHRRMSEWPEKSSGYLMDLATRKMRITYDLTDRIISQETADKELAASEKFYNDSVFYDDRARREQAEGQAREASERRGDAHRVENILNGKRNK